MPRTLQDKQSAFGKRLVTLRKVAGYTQVELAEELGVTQRMISYYEGRAEHPPAHLVPALARVLGVSADTLLGITPVKKSRQSDTRLQRRFQQIDKLSAKDKRQVIQLLDAFIERGQLKQKING